MMISKYIKYLPWMILGTLSSYLLATDYARNSFDLFYLTLNFTIVYIALIVFYEKVLRDKCKELFIRIMSTPKKDKQGYELKSHLRMAFSYRFSIFL